MSTIRPNRPSPFKDPSNQVDVESGFQSYNNSYEKRLFERVRQIWVRKAAMGSSVSMILFLIVGVSFFRSVTNWTWSQSLFFAISTATSVGYGHVDTPRTAHFQLFLSLYILVGFALLAIVAAQLYQFFARDEPEPEKRPVDRSSPSSSHTIKQIPKHSEIFGLWEGEMKRAFRKTHHERALSIGFPLFIVFVIGTLAIGNAEQWSFHEALYFAVVSSTTVGYGDLTPQTTLGLLLTCIWLPCSIVFMSICMGTIARWYLKDLRYKSSILRSIERIAGKSLGPHVLPTSLLLVGALLIGQQEEWTCLESVYFAVVSSCTVGYGDIHPRTTMGMLMTILWLPCSILSISVYMTIFARFFLRLSSQIVEELDSFVRRTRIVSACGGTIVVALPLLVTLLTGALVVGHMEQWSLLESVYFALVSSFTVGYGDYTPITTGGMVFTCTWLPCNLVFTSVYMGSIAQWYLSLSLKKIQRMEDQLRRHGSEEPETEMAFSSP